MAKKENEADPNGEAPTVLETLNGLIYCFDLPVGCAFEP